MLMTAKRSANADTNATAPAPRAIVSQNWFRSRLILRCRRVLVYVIVRLLLKSQKKAPCAEAHEAVCVAKELLRRDLLREGGQECHSRLT